MNRPRVLHLLFKMVIRWCLMWEGLVLLYRNFLFKKDCSEMHSGSCSQMTSSRKCPILWHQSLTLYFCHSVSGVFLGPTGRTILWYQSLLRTNLFFQLWQRFAYLFDISWIIETNLLVADWWRYFMYHTCLMNMNFSRKKSILIAAFNFTIGQFHNHAQWVNNSGGPLDSHTWYTNGWPQQKFPQFGFSCSHNCTVANGAVFYSGMLVPVRTSFNRKCSILSAKFDCPVAHQNISLSATAHDYETG